MEKYDWIIGKCNTDGDGVDLYRFRGSMDEVKEKIYSMVLEDREKNKDDWDFGCENVDDVRACDNGLGYEFYGYGVYSTYHIDYTAKEIAHIETVN